MKKDKLYSILGLACLAGYLYLLLFVFILPENLKFGVCIFKHITGIPCPSCGATRAVMLLMRGDVIGSILTNPIGILLAIAMLGIPIWLIADLSLKKQSLYHFYQRSERFIRKPGIAIFCVLLVLINWFWGISKGL